MNDNYLQHYGVLGMKWGIRKKEYSKTNSNKIRKIKSQRQKDYQYLKEQSNIYRKAANKDRQGLKNIKKEGVKSKEFKSEYGKNAYKDIGLSKKEAINFLKSDYKKSMTYNTNHHKLYESMIKSFNNTPENKKTLMDKKRRNESISKGAFAVGTILGSSGSVALGILTASPTVALGTAVTTLFLGSYGISKVVPTSDEKIYNRYGKKYS